MEVADDYLFAWCLYAISAFFLMLVCWRLTAFIGQADLRSVLRAVSFTLLVLPAQIDPELSYWAPAIMAILMESVTISLDAATKRLWPLLAAMLLAVVLSLIWRYLLRKKSTK